MRERTFFSFILVFFLQLQANTVLAKTCDAVVPNEPLHARIDIKYKDASSTNTVRSTGEKLPGRFGGQRVRLSRTGSVWLSKARSTLYDPQGDPRFFMAAFGERIASFFGFEQESDDSLLVPDADEFNGAIAVVNERLVAKGKEPIFITFYPTSSASGDLRKYLEMFRDNWQLPVADSGNPFVHDIAFHTSSIVTPKEFLIYNRQRLQFVLNLVDLYDQNASQFITEKKREIARKLIRGILLDEVKAVDSASGLPVFNLIVHQKNVPEPVYNQILDLMDKKFSITNPADVDPSSLFIKSSGFWLLSLAALDKRHDVSPVDSIIRSLLKWKQKEIEAGTRPTDLDSPYSEMKKVLYNYVQTFPPPKRDKLFSPNFPPPSILRSQRADTAYFDKFNNIREAVKELLSER